MTERQQDPADHPPEQPRGPEPGDDGRVTDDGRITGAPDAGQPGQSGTE